MGRSHELAVARASLERGEAGLVLAGPAGAGKTALAQEIMEIAVSLRLYVRRVTATKTASAIPLGAMASVLPGFVPSERDIDNRVSLLLRARAALLEKAGGRRAVFLVDDAHLLDETSATLIHSLVSSTDAYGLLTVRDDQPCPDAVAVLWKDGLVERIEVRSLSATHIEEVLSTVLGGRIERRTLTQFCERSRGNALFLRELFRSADAAEQLVNEGGVWRLRGDLAPSHRLTEIVGAQIAGLTDKQKQMLELIAFSEPVGPGELAHVGELASVNQLEDRGLVASAKDGSRLVIRVVQPVVGDVVLSRVSDLRRREMAMALAEASEATGARRHTDLLRIATWRLESGGAKPHLMLAAAAAARWHHDYELGYRLARAAVEAGGGFDACLLAAQLEGLRGDSASCERSLAALGQTASTDAERALVAMNELDGIVFHSGRFDEGLGRAEQALATISDPVWRDEILARVSGIHLGLGGPRACAELAEQLLERASGRAYGWACITGAYSLGRLGRHSASMDASARGLAIRDSLERPLDWDPCLYRYFVLQSLAQLGRVMEAFARANAERDEAIADGNPDGQAYASLFLGQLACERGQGQEAVDSLREAEDIFRMLGRPGQVQFCLAYMVAAQAVLADANGARESVAAIELLGSSEEHSPVATDIQFSKAWVAIADGDLPLARDLLSSTAKAGQTRGDHVAEVAALHVLARIGYPAEALGRLEELAELMEGDLIQLRLAHVRALKNADAPELNRASRAFEDMGLTLLAAESAADEALVYRRACDTRCAGRAAQVRSRALAELCPGVSTPALQDVPARAALTRAEREVALLASAHTNKEIADKLFLSVRTVENHLQHAYKKLGIGSRAELVPALSANGDPASRPLVLR
ncbi:LuxR C-terminal-related transcriptional regulator [Sporichthya sp.]|uniref:helix-turn-helix transcriptional regulator n=1 Tax=Sporichthya sp. TaxID=65475 RepID=UPI00345C615D